MNSRLWASRVVGGANFWPDFWCKTPSATRGYLQVRQCTGSSVSFPPPCVLDCSCAPMVTVSAPGFRPGVFLPVPNYQ